ncbi:MULTISPECIES: glycosyltransferase family 2 protein [unclassified Streptococcus]|uniref:glycosyltransferase family 2 protein n=1 Tax=unclassified Streptococcus TaxID=2608887 RepID=UPI00107161A3|nr:MULTISPECIES: glycosyltransferase family 2 protein [unclassified Streptococcus]MBF0787149.1 glycosyltransferase family 2 protein [Streptococcus sp. 19428wC2_LYSM12]MCQ9212135.1 glycosyltransferase [Streptococcus sp. B01]MCQ9213464.1 glycosyltransferase [Streptococcus sp. O1]TFV05904.1 glycosyltransferase family 2 protein [Streptococcus sp. LYSM12]
MEKISVVVPVYNGEKYLKMCIESIMKQTYSQLEIVVINDGSTDGTGLLIEQLCVQDRRIRVLHKKQNEGLGAARNSALDMVTGDYLVFVDSDDWIDPNHIEDLYDLLRRTDSDIAITNFTQYVEETGHYNLHITDKDYYEAVYRPEEWFAFQYGHPHNLSLCFTVPWCKLYKTSLFETIRYPTDGFGEDDKTTWKTYLMADKIAYMHRSSYLYRVNTGSMTQTTNLSTVFSTQPVAERLEVLSLLGFDVSREVAAYKWRAQLNRDSELKAGNMTRYKELEFRLKLLEKYGK